MDQTWRYPIAAIAVTYTFSNSTTADAGAVNQNFTDLVNGLSDGTKDISVNAGTFAGNVSISGNTTIGNASGDDLTVTASLASSIPIKTTNTYDIGSSTLGLRALYFGANSQTVKIQGSSSMSATWTFTFPVTAGTTGMTMITDGSGTMSYRYIEKTAAKTTTYTGTGDETTILCDASGAAFTVTLPAAASYTGKHYHIKKTDSSTNAVTIDGNASETIDGATTTTVSLQYETLTIISDGSNWHVVNRTYPLVSFSANTSTTAGATSTPFIYTTEDHDTHNAYSTSTGIFTVPAGAAGKYSFKWNNYTGSTAAQGKIHKNGTAVSTGSSSIANVACGSGGYTLSLIAGDTVEIRPETNATATGGATLNTFSGFMVGK